VPCGEAPLSPVVLDALEGGAGKKGFGTEPLYFAEIGGAPRELSGAVFWAGFVAALKGGGANF
jgi:hypothetical protein